MAGGWVVRDHGMVLLLLRLRLLVLGRNVLTMCCGRIMILQLGELVLLLGRRETLLLLDRDFLLLAIPSRWTRASTEVGHILHLLLGTLLVQGHVGGVVMLELLLSARMIAVRARLLGSCWMVRGMNRRGLVLTKLMVLLLLLLLLKKRQLSSLRIIESRVVTLELWLNGVKMCHRTWRALGMTGRCSNRNVPWS